MLTFDIAFDRLILAEGKFTNDSKDPGNWTGGRVGVGSLNGTNWGLSASTYPDLDLKNMTQAQARIIYYRDWWLKIAGDQLPAAVVENLWDFSVNSGMSNAKRAMQRAIGVADDGQFGLVTIAKINSIPVPLIILAFNAQRIRFYTSLSTFDVYGRGWMSRVAQQLDYAVADLK